MIFLVDISDSQNKLSDTLTFLSKHLRNTFLFIFCHAAVAHSRRMPRNGDYSSLFVPYGFSVFSIHHTM